jgi:hypothetical protein
MNDPATAIHDANANASASMDRSVTAGHREDEVRWRHPQAPLGGALVVCGLTTRFPSRLAPPHPLLPVHTSTGLTLLAKRR